MDSVSARFPGHRMILAVLFIMGADLFALMLALLFAFCIRTDFLPPTQIYQVFLRQHLLSCAVGAGIYLAVFAVFRLYRHAWRFASLEMVGAVINANTIALLLAMALQRWLDGSIFPISVFIIFWMLSICLIGGVRIFLRLAHIGHVYETRLAAPKDHNPVRAVIFGAGEDGARLLTALREDACRRYTVIGFLDDDPGKHNIYTRGVRVLGPFAHIHALLDAGAVDEVLIANPQAGGSDIREYVLACRRRQVAVRVIPGLREMLHGPVCPRLEEISVDDLLRRPPVRIDMHQLHDSITGKRVLVTGAGGSIGSELCRQILSHDPKSLILMGHGENSIDRIYQELAHRYPARANRLHMVIGSVADDVRIGQIFDQYRPQVVYHAAAHKHVPIMEENIAEAVHNNVIGTSNIAEACGRYQLERLVLISTDKAVYPSSVMGATKWLCEEVVRTLTTVYPKTTYLAVRFGNVLGSRGSVAPIFQEQIRQGGPVTVTHPEMTRYFMTIPEAVQLVLQAGVIGKSGDLYILDMGQPVKILDLARDLIRLSGMEPDVDISITFTGLRSGEKLHEQLVQDDIRMTPAACERMSLIRQPSSFSITELRDLLLRFRLHASANNRHELHRELSKAIPGFPFSDPVVHPDTSVKEPSLTISREPGASQSG